MSDESRPTPNTHLGEVHWYADICFGTHLWLCQMIMGLHKPSDKDESFLNTKTQSVAELWEFFEEIKLSNGMLGLELYADQDWHTLIVAEIETTIPYDSEESVSDQSFLNLIEDFKEYVRRLPLAKAGDGALITDPDQPGYYEKSNQRWLTSVREINQMLGAVFDAAAEELRNEGITVTPSHDTSKDDVEF